MSEKKIFNQTKEQLIEKWLPVIEGKGKWEFAIDKAPKVSASQYGTLAQLLENTSENILTEASVSGDIAKYQPVLIPMIRRVAPALIANDVFGVQPLSGPSGLIFMLKAYYANDSVNGVKPATSTILVLADATNFPVDGDISGGTSGATGKVRFKDGNNLLVEVTSGTFADGEDVDNASTFTAGETTISAIYDNEAIINALFPNYTGSYATATGEALSTDMKEVGFEIISKSVEAKSRKLKAKWTLELEEDLKAVHNLDAEMLLSNIASEEITHELNREFINYIDTLATQAPVTTWDYSAADGRWEVEKYQNLLALISRVRKQIAFSSKRGQANYMIVSPDVAAALENTGRMSSQNVDPYLSAYIGDIMGMKVFVDIFATSNYITLGYKGADETDAGFFYAPYIPLKIEKGFGEEDGQPRLFFRSRYGVAESPVGGKNYFRKILVTNLPFSA